jgi:uncharacterized protein DUF6636
VRLAATALAAAAIVLAAGVPAAGADSPGADRAAAAAGLQSFTGFQSPSGNIGCVIGRRGGVRCDIRNRDWRPPPKPASCMLDWGFGLTVGRRGRGRFVCAGDTTLGQGRRLAYGDAIRRGRFRCVSRRSGMRCTNRRNGHGFSLSRERARRF